MKICSGFTLKLFALFVMTLDHCYAFLNGADGLSVPIWFGYLGRLAAPIFFFLLVEGYLHTHNKLYYALRLFAMAGVMALLGYFLHFSNNIFLSLGCGFALIYGLEGVEISQEKKDRTSAFIWGLISLAFGAAMIFTEASIYGLAMVLIFYLLRKKPLWRNLAYAVFSLLLLLPLMGPNFAEAALAWDYQWMMVFALIPISLYSGKRGPKAKWLFYTYYPLHLVLFATLSNILRTGAIFG